MEAPTGKIYAVTRASTTSQKDSPEIQSNACIAWCKKESIPEPTVLDEPLGTSGTIPFKKRPQGKWLVTNARPGDMVIFDSVDRVGRNMVDIMVTVRHFKNMGVKVVILQFGGMDLDLSTDMGQLMLMIFAWGSEYELKRIRERTMRGRQKKIDEGTYCCFASYGKKKIRTEHGAHWEWDHDQLKYICEIAHRLGKGEAPATIAADFWRRGLKDHRGLPWGINQAKDTSKPQTSSNKYHHYRAASRWFHRMKHANKLPPPYCDLARLCQETSKFTVETRYKRPNPPKPTPVDDKANWTTEQWRDWYGNEYHDDVA